MAKEEKDNSGVLYENQERKGDSSPDCKGTVTVNGRKYWISAWWKPGKDGKPDFQSLALQPVEDRGGGGVGNGGGQGNRGRSHQGGGQQRRGGYQGGRDRDNNGGPNGGGGYGHQQEPQRGGNDHNRW